MLSTPPVPTPKMPLADTQGGALGFHRAFGRQDVMGEVRHSSQTKSTAVPIRLCLGLLGERGLCTRSPLSAATPNVLCTRVPSGADAPLMSVFCGRLLYRSRFILPALLSPCLSAFPSVLRIQALSCALRIKRD